MLTEITLAAKSRYMSKLDGLFIERNIQIQISEFTLKHTGTKLVYNTSKLVLHKQHLDCLYEIFLMYILKF